MTKTALPRIKYFPRRIVVDATNNKIDFEETVSTELNATITSGTYTIGDYRKAVEDALNAAGASVYTVTYSATTRLYTLTSDGTGGGGVFSILWSSGTNTATNARTELGFDNVDETGALTYNSDSAVPASKQFDFTEPIRSPTYRENVLHRNNYSINGTPETIFLRKDQFFAFSMQFILQADIDDWFAFMNEAFLAGSQFDFFPDKDVSGNHIALISEARSFIPQEQNDVGLLGYFKFSVSCRVVQAGINTPEASSTIDFETLTDRVNL